MSLEFSEAPFGSDPYPALFQLRREILRLPLGLDFTAADIAAERYDFHLAAYESGELVAGVLLRPAGGHTIKLRQMVVAPAAQGRGIGAQLIRHAEQFAAARGFTIIEMHARKTVQSFYEKCGYVAEGPEFEEVTIPHLKMRKDL